MAGGSVTFQPQNPAKSGDKSTYRNAKGQLRKTGWSNCTAFVAAMGAEFDSGVRITGTQVRQESSEQVPDPASPGLNLSQIRDVLGRHGVRIAVETPIDFDDLDDLRLAGHAIGLQLGYEPILRSPFTGSRTFKDGHIVLWLPSGDVYDPLDDGRQGLVRAPVRIPREILRQAAGSLVIRKGRTVGLGRAYAAVFPTRHPAGGAAPHVAAAVAFGFGATGSGAGVYQVNVPVALVRSAPSGVPAKANVIARRARGTQVNVVATTGRGQKVGGSRIWHQVNKAGTAFMHSSVIGRIDRGFELGVDDGGPGSPDDRDLPPVVADPDVNGVDESDDTADVDESPKTDVPDLDEDEEDAADGAPA